MEDKKLPGGQGLSSAQILDLVGENLIDKVLIEENKIKKEI